MIINSLHQQNHQCHGMLKLWIIGILSEKWTPHTKGPSSFMPTHIKGNRPTDKKSPTNVMVIPKGAGPSIPGGFFVRNKSGWWGGNQKIAAGGTFPTDRQPAPSLQPVCLASPVLKPTALGEFQESLHRRRKLKHQAPTTHDAKTVSSNLAIITKMQVVQLIRGRRKMYCHSCTI